MAVHISSFKELLNEIAWNWEYPTYDFELYEDGTLVLNKLYISHKSAKYKTEQYVLAPEVYEKALAFYYFLQDNDS